MESGLCRKFWKEAFATVAVAAVQYLQYHCAANANQGKTPMKWIK